MLGGGNPSHIPAVQAQLRQRMESILQRDNAFECLVGNYGPPQGDPAFLTAVATLLRDQYGWPISERNIVLTNGSQTAAFYLFNLFAGAYPDGSFKKVLLPLAPEYIGYADQPIAGDIFVANRPQIELLGDCLFKYRVNLDTLQVTADIGAICVSRPTNPTGNVLTDSEMAVLHSLARQHNIPLIIDNAYGAPFPGIIFSEVTPIWDEHIVLLMSLSKLGLPGTRTGIVIANERIVQAIAGLNAILSLAPGNFGPTMALELMQSGEVLHLSRDVINPHYRQKADHAVAWMREELDGTPAAIHKPEGTFFLWLWFKDLPITSQALYERLKQRRVLVVPGHHFFPGLSEPWQHKQECIRMNFAMDTAVVRQGIRIIGEEARRAYQVSSRQ
jgi:valine--pyruvate aminotransferase